MRVFLLLIAFCLQIVPLAAQKTKLNADWKFQRLDGIEREYEIANQGSGWEAQFNITHTVSTNELAVAEDTLKSEFQQLQLGEWEQVTVPHIPKVEDLVVLHQWQGICYYQKDIEYSSDWNNKKVLIEFEGAMQLADIWVNGNHVMQHAGGYDPFVIDLTDLLNKEENNEVLVRLDNRDNPLIPPGKPLETLDFCYYGGIYRNVNLILKPKDVYITHPIMANEVAGGGVFVTYPKVSESQADVDVKTHIKNESKDSKYLNVKQSVIELNGLYGNYTKGITVSQCAKSLHLSGGQDKHLNQLMTVNNPLLWDTETPNLYILLTEVYEGDTLIDKQETRIGIRHIEYTKDKGFYLNGKPVRLVGANRHMEYPYIGNSISDNAQYRDIYQMKHSGFNVVRLGHYPQTTSVLEACDELGIMAIEPIPGWQFFNKSPLFTELTYRDVRAMIRRDRNHPSVIMWETTLNESWPPNYWKNGAVKAAHEEYPTDQMYTSGDGYGYDGFDVVYNDWKDGYIRPTPSSKPGFIREYYDFEFGGHYSTTRVGRADGESKLLQNAWNAQWSHNRYRKQYPSTSGDAVWSMYDYNRGCCDNICESGVADMFRLAKFSVPFFKSQVPIGEQLPEGEMKPYLFIANYWTARPASADTVVVYANVDEVELKVNGKIVARQYSDEGADTEYVASTDGGNSNNLSQAPFTFKGITWSKGSIEAIGYVDGKQVATTKRTTPKAPRKLNITYFEEGRKAGKNDHILVYVEILDRKGTLCVEDSSIIELTVNVGNEIKGPTQINATAGVAAFLVSTGDIETLSIRARSKVGSAKKGFDLVEM